MVKQLKRELKQARKRLKELEAIHTLKPRQRRTVRGLIIDTQEHIWSLEIALGIQPVRRARY